MSCSRRRSCAGGLPDQCRAVGGGGAGVPPERAPRPDPDGSAAPRSGRAARSRARSRRIRELAPIPVIALTAYAMTDDRAHAIAAGCDGYIAKPINTRTFVAEPGRSWRIALRRIGPRIDSMANSPPERFSSLTTTPRTCCSFARSWSGAATSSRPPRVAAPGSRESRPIRPDLILLDIDDARSEMATPFASSSRRPRPPVRSRS